MAEEDREQLVAGLHWAVGLGSTPLEGTQGAAGELVARVSLMLAASPEAVVELPLTVSDGLDMFSFF